MLKKVHRSLIWLASWIVMPVSTVWLLCQLVRDIRKYRQADVLFHEVFMGNYGGHVQVIQMARRHHKGKKIIATFLYEPGSTHNLKLGLIFPDILIWMIRKTCFVFYTNGRKCRLPSDEIFIPIKEAISNFFISLFAPATGYQVYSDLVYHQQIPPQLKGTISENYGEDAAVRGLYFALIWSGHFKREYEDPSMAKLRLPEPLRQEIHEKLKAVRHGREARLCMSYNKFEEVADYVRQGSTMGDYLPALRMLVAQGYQVLLAGDRNLDQSQMDDFDGMVVDARSLGVEKDMFRLFAPTEADICIGDAGAGILLPLIGGIPILVLNYYPFGIGSPGKWVYPKRYVDEAGNIVPYQRAFEEDLFGIYGPARKEPLRISPVCNSEEEITEAVEHFLEDVASPSDVVPGEELVALVPKTSPFYAYGSRFSPAFIRRNWMISSEGRPEKTTA